MSKKRLVVNILNKWKKISPAKKASLALVFASFFQRGISMISTPIFTRIMDTNQYGIITNFTSWQSIILIIATLNLAQGVFNNGMLDFKEDRNVFTSSMVILSNICTIFVFILYAFFHPYLQPVIGLSDSMMLLMFLYMLFYPAYSYWSCRQRYEFKYKALTLITVLVAIAQMLLGIIAVLFSDVNQQGLAKLVSTEAVLIIVGVIIHIVILAKSGFKCKSAYMKYAFKFNIFLVPHFLAMSVLASGDKVMITSLVGESKTAIYGVSYTAASVILIFWQAIEASWTPWLYEHLKVNDKKPIKERANQIITIFAAITILCMLFAPEIMGILASKEYLEGIYIIPSVTTGVYFMAVYALYMRIEYYSKKTKATMIGSILAAITNIVLNYIFIEIFGYIAAGYTTLLCYVLLYLFHLWYSRRIGMKNIYNDWYIFFLSVIMIGISILITFVYRTRIVRYVVILLLTMVCCFFYKRIINQLKKIIS